MAAVNLVIRAYESDRVKFQFVKKVGGLIFLLETIQDVSVFKTFKL